MKSNAIYSMTRETGTGTGDESSYSSYSSFLKTDDSMKSSEEAETAFNGNHSEKWNQVNRQNKPPPRPVRKV